MDPEIYEHRIDELEVYKKKLDDKIVDLQKERTEIHGAIKEMWRWWEKNKDAGEYGSVRYDGRNKIHILPKFGSPEALEQGLKTRLDAQLEDDIGIVLASRKDRGKQDAQKAVDEMDKMNSEHQTLAGGGEGVGDGEPEPSGQQS